MSNFIGDAEDLEIALEIEQWKARAEAAEADAEIQRTAANEMFDALQAAEAELAELCSANEVYRTSIHDTVEMMRELEAELASARAERDEAVALWREYRDGQTRVISRDLEAAVARVAQLKAALREIAAEKHAPVIESLGEANDLIAHLIDIACRALGGKS